MKDRVKQVQEHYKLSQKQFAAELGVAEATISSIYRGRTAPTNNLIQAIHLVYPAINVNWLMFGEGEMLVPLTGHSAGVAPASPELASLMPGMMQDNVGQNVGYGSTDGPTLFDAPPVTAAPQKAPKNANYSALPSEVQIAEALALMKKANEVDKPVRKIKEIRVFFDDGTFEAFTPSSK